MASGNQISSGEDLADNLFMYIYLVGSARKWYDEFNSSPRPWLNERNKVAGDADLSRSVWVQPIVF